MEAANKIIPFQSPEMDIHPAAMAAAQLIWINDLSPEMFMAAYHKFEKGPDEDTPGLISG